MYSAQETYIFKEPTNRSHPISLLLKSYPIWLRKSACECVRTQKCDSEILKRTHLECLSPFP